MYCKLICVFVLLAETSQGWGMVYDIPRELHECVDARRNKTESDTGNPYTPLEEDIHVQCLQEFLWKTDIVNWSSFNITRQEMAYVNSLIPSLIRPRRRKNNKKKPETGFRIRREYRMLNDSEREAFHDAINVMKYVDIYDIFANMHRGIVVRSAHNGPNFFSWHRVYLCIFEEALRLINPNVSLPYWDSTMDYDMDYPIFSNIWSSNFLGNGDGFVITGPFAYWMTPVGPLTRNIGGSSRLFQKSVIEKILTCCYTREICVPTALPQYNLEYAHGGPHVWIGGQMSGLNTAAHDPVFFLHHAFVDLIWEQFRRRQKKKPCKVKPWNDYPSQTNVFFSSTTDVLQAPGRKMEEFPEYKNKDGYKKYWTKTWYDYEDSPTCSANYPFCGTDYLRCDDTRTKCISIEKIMEAQAPMMMERFGFAANGATIIDTANKVKEEVDSIDVGQPFNAPP